MTQARDRSTRVLVWKRVSECALGQHVCRHHTRTRARARRTRNSDLQPRRLQRAYILSVLTVYSQPLLLPHGVGAGATPLYPLSPVLRHRARTRGAHPAHMLTRMPPVGACPHPPLHTPTHPHNVPACTRCRLSNQPWMILLIVSSPSRCRFIRDFAPPMTRCLARLSRSSATHRLQHQPCKN